MLGDTDSPRVVENFKLKIFLTLYVLFHIVENWNMQFGHNTDYWKLAQSTYISVFYDV